MFGMRADGLTSHVPCLQRGTTAADRTSATVVPDDRAEDAKDDGATSSWSGKVVPERPCWQRMGRKRSWTNGPWLMLGASGGVRQRAGLCDVMRGWWLSLYETVTCRSGGLVPWPIIQISETARDRPARDFLKLRAVAGLVVPVNGADA